MAEKVILQRRLCSQLWQVCYAKVQVLVGKERDPELVFLNKLTSFYMGYYINRLGKTMQTEFTFHLARYIRVYSYALSGKIWWMPFIQQTAKLHCARHCYGRYKGKLITVESR